jgi:hypothetical protein
MVKLRRGLVCMGLAGMILVAFSSSFAFAQAKKAKQINPGVARWAIKTSIPADADVGHPKDVELTTLLTIEPPPGAQGHSRTMDARRYPQASNAGGLAEGEIIAVKGWIHLIASEPDDGDYHIQIAQTDRDMTRCFIVEVPRPEARFVKADSRVLDAAKKVRAGLQSNVLGGKPLRDGQVQLVKPVFARIIGQFFYDDWHIGDPPRGKKGCQSPTIAEVHPIMAVEFPPQ